MSTSHGFQPDRVIKKSGFSVRTMSSLQKSMDLREFNSQICGKRMALPTYICTTQENSILFKNNSLLCTSYRQSQAVK